MSLVDEDGTFANPTTVAVSVAPAGGGNGSPVAADDSYSVQEGRVLTVAAPGLLANDSDPDSGDGVTAFQFFQGAHGSVALTQDGSFTYTPDAGFSGSDSFVYVITDGIATAQATVAITVVEGNPTPADDSYSVLHDRALTIAAPGLLANDTDPNGDAVAAFQFFQPTNGAVSLTQDGSFVYTPNAGFVGSDSFVYAVTDGVLTGQATVAINVTNSIPVAADDSYSVQEGRVLTVAAPGLLANDSDPDSGDGVTAFQFFQGAHGSVALTQDGSFTYTPDAGFSGSDSFVYVITDGIATAQATVAITVVEGNPTPADDSYSVQRDSTLVIAAPGVLANDTDPNGDVITAFQYFQPTNGAVSLTQDGSFVYTPNAGFVGSDSFTYTVIDGALTGTATVTINVVVGNADPVAVDDAYAMRPNETLTIAAPGVLDNDTDADGDAVVVTSVTDGVDNGTLTALPDGSFTYAPNAGFTGTDSFSYAVSDGQGGTDTGTVTLTVSNAAPVADDDNYVVTAGQTLSVPAAGFLIGDTDADGDALTATSITDGTDNGSLTASPDGGFSYTPNAGFTGTDSFSYSVSDGFGGTDTGLVTIDVVPGQVDTVRIGDAPVRQSGAGGQWQAAWTNSIVDIDHKADYTSASETWSAATRNGVSSQTLPGGDIYQGDLGVSGRSITSSTVVAELDGKEALRFNLDQEATEVTVNLSRFYINDDGGLFVESGLLRLRDSDGNLVGEKAFRAGNTAGTQQVSLAAAEGFVSVELLAGAYNGDTFMFGGYSKADGSFGANAGPDAQGRVHGSDLMIDWIEFDFPVVGVAATEPA